MESRREIHDRRIKNLEKYIDKREEGLKYATKRTDILVISLSTTALVLTIGFAKDLATNSKYEILLLKYSWICFVFTIIINLLSQTTSYYANNFENKHAKNRLRQHRGRTIIGNQELNNIFSQKFNWLTIVFNSFGMFLLILGCLLALIFFCNYLN